jgi:uncharacterized membrane protein YvbJ
MSGVQIFQCPGCKEYIASDATSCRFCHRPIDPQTRQAAVAAQEAENRSYRKKQSVKMMLLGLGLLTAGIIITGGTYTLAAYSSGGGHFIMTWGLIIVGGLRFLQGLSGWVKGK